MRRHVFTPLLYDQNQRDHQLQPYARHDGSDLHTSVLCANHHSLLERVNFGDTVTVIDYICPSRSTFFVIAQSSVHKLEDFVKEMVTTE